MKALKITLAILILIVLTACLFGCDFLSDLFSKKFDAPNVSVVGNTIIWDKIKDAEKYEVYCNNVLKATTENNFYVSNDNDKTTEYYVIAKNDKPKQDSEPSNKVIVYQQTNFSEDDILTIDLESKTYMIMPTTKKLIVSGSANNTCIVIANRDSDLFIELNDVTMTAPNGKSCIATQDDCYDASISKFGVTIKINGTNMLAGGDYTALPSKPNGNSQEKGGKGGNGGSGIVLPLVSLCGDGSLTLKGGIGGKGGTGADSSGASTKRFGAGGDGGTGGYGIKTTKLVLSMSEIGIVKSYGGNGGNGGTPGANGSIMTGPLYTSSWKNYYGSKGNDGQSLLGNIFICGGLYIDE